MIDPSRYPQTTRMNAVWTQLNVAVQFLGWAVNEGEKAPLPWWEVLERLTPDQRSELFFGLASKYFGIDADALERERVMLEEEQKRGVSQEVLEEEHEERQRAAYLSIVRNLLSTTLRGSGAQSLPSMATESEIRDLLEEFLEGVEGEEVAFLYGGELSVIVDYLLGKGILHS